MENNRIYDPESPIQHTNGGMTITNTSTLVLAENFRRKHFVIANDSITEVYLGIGQPAVIGAGLPLVTKGSNYECSMKDAANIQSAIYAISTGTSNITFIEGE